MAGTSFLQDIGIHIVTSSVLFWGVLTFGAVHDWALWPLMIGCWLTGAVIVCTTPRQSFKIAPLVLVALVVVSIALQLVPLTRETAAALSPSLAEFLSRYDIAAGSGVTTEHSLSIAPALTLRTLAMFASLAVFAAGMTMWVRPARCLRWIAASLVWIGVTLGLLALAQKSMSNGRIYWFWESEFRAANNYYGPFVNRNHFAGWMLLASAVVAGYLVAQVATAARQLKPGWRNRVLWLSTPDASYLILTACALFVMLVSLVWSMSRSGIAGAALALAIVGITAIVRLRSSARKTVASAGLAFLLLFAVGAKGADALAQWYGKTNTFQWRVQLWKDTLPALKDFYLTGSGLNTYGNLMLMYPETDRTQHAFQAHNDYLQIAVEGGLLVGIPVLIVIGFFVRAAARRLKQPQDEMTWWIRLGAVAGICGMAVQEVTEFSLQIPGVAVLFAVLVAIAIHEPAPIEERRRIHSRRELSVAV